MQRSGAPLLGRSCPSIGSLLCALGLLASSSGLPPLTAEEENRLCLSGDEQVAPGAIAVITVSSTASFPIEGMQFAVCSDTARLSIESAAMSDAAISRLNDGKGPEFVKQFVDAGQVKFFMIVNYPTPKPAALPAGTQEILQIRYRAEASAPSGITQLVFCEDEVIAAFSDEEGREVFPSTCEAQISISGGGGDEPPFRRGDMNQDGKRNVTDMITILQHLFAGKLADCAKAGDANDDGVLEITDAVFLGNYLFAGGPPLPRPLDECGTDPTADEMECGSFRGCQ